MNTIRTARHATLFAFAALVAGASAPAIAASDPAPKSAAAPAKPAAQAGDKTRYCVKQKITGSRLARPAVCRTRAEWIARTGIDPVES